MNVLFLEVIIAINGNEILIIYTVKIIIPTFEQIKL